MEHILDEFIQKHPRRSQSQSMVIHQRPYRNDSIREIFQCDPSSFKRSEQQQSMHEESDDSIQVRHQQVHDEEVINLPCDISDEKNSVSSESDSPESSQNDKWLYRPVLKVYADNND